MTLTLRGKLAVYEYALECIAKWDVPKLSGHFRCTGEAHHDKTCDGACGQYSFVYEYGSNGAEAYIADVASQALRRVKDDR